MTTIDSLRALAAQIDGNDGLGEEESRLLEAVIARNTTADNRHVNVDQIQRDLRDIAAAHGGRRDAAWLNTLSERIEAVAPRPSETASPVRAIRGAIVDSEKNRGTSAEYVGWLTRGEPAGEHFFQALSTVTGRSADELRGMDRLGVAEVLDTLPASLEQTWQRIQREVGATPDGKPGNRTFGRIDEARGDQDLTAFVHSIIGEPGPTESEAAELDAARGGLEVELNDVATALEVATTRFDQIRSSLMSEYQAAEAMPEGDARTQRMATLDEAIGRLSSVEETIEPIGERLAAGQAALEGNDAAAIGTAAEALSADGEALAAANTELDGIADVLESVDAANATAELEAGLAEAETLQQALLGRHEELARRNAELWDGVEQDSAESTLEAAVDQLSTAGTAIGPAANALAEIREALAGENPDVAALQARLSEIRRGLDDASGRLDAAQTALDEVGAGVAQRVFSSLASDAGINNASSIANAEALGAGAVRSFHMNQARMGALIAQAHDALSPADFDDFMRGVFTTRMGDVNEGELRDPLPAPAVTAGLLNADRGGAILAEQLADPDRHGAAALAISRTDPRADSRFTRAIEQLEPAQLDRFFGSVAFSNLDEATRARLERLVESARN